MGKEDNLKDFLVDLYEGIVSKKPDASKNPQDFRSEIESIETDSPLPIEISSAVLMTSTLITAEVGSIYKFTGDSVLDDASVFEKDALYEVRKDAEGENYFEKLIKESEQSTTPQEISTEEEMTALLETAEVGSVYKYVGETTDTYENGVKYEVCVALISFTLDGTSYQAESGMSISSWYNSEYNKDNLTITGTGVFTVNGSADTVDASYIIQEGDTIVENVPTSND